jgi:pyridinium-3,5-bisthiocarboxylic acid mononucleotide nickel chelatase
VKVAHIDPFSGASGDMLLGAVIDAGAPLDDIIAALEGLSLPGWTLSTEATTRGAIGATRAIVRTDEGHVVRTWPNVRDILTGADLPEPVRARALATCRRLAHTEARIHRTDAERVRFHEVGGLDAIVDVVGVCAGLHLLGIERITSGPVAQGVGMVRSAHGLLPVPAPAVLELLRGAPTFTINVTAELCTPTGAALLAECVDEWTPLPHLVLGAVGYGAGYRELDHPNVLRIVTGTTTRPVGSVAAIVLETTVDDLAGELVPPVLDALRAAGAGDAWARPVVMKKGRPGVELACIGPVDRAEALRRVLFEQTTTLGVRASTVDKWELDREYHTVEVAGHPVRLKVGRLSGRVLNVAPEFDDCLAAAEATGIPLKDVYATARAAWPHDAEAPDGRSPGPGDAGPTSPPRGRPA